MIQPNQIYQHYKGHTYKILALAKHSETLEDLVIYEALYNNPTSQLWARPLSLFTDSIEINGQKVPRFKQLI